MQSSNHQQEAFLSNINQQQQTALAPICNNNNSFSTTVKHELFEQKVNAIYLNTIGRGIMTYNNNELSALRIIAADCPQEGGVAVHQARGMLSMVEDVNLLDFDCSTNRQGKANVKTENDIVDIWEVVLYPNPTAKELTIESNLILENNTRVEVYNALGQKVKTISINEAIQNIKIDASSLLDGVYIMRLKNGDNSVTKTFVVAK